MALRAVGQQEGGLVPHLEEVGGLLGELFRVAWRPVLMTSWCELAADPASPAPGDARPV